jgi:hypothetical protein
MARIRSRFGLLEPDHEAGHECHESECQPRHPRYETPPEPLSQPAKLTTEGCPPFRFEDRDFIVVVAAICGKRPERRLALAAGVFELCPNVLAALILFAPSSKPVTSHTRSCETKRRAPHSGQWSILSVGVPYSLLASSGHDDCQSVSSVSRWTRVVF